jgi:hypothetical protein
MDIPRTVEAALSAVPAAPAADLGSVMDADARARAAAAAAIAGEPAPA